MKIAIPKERRNGEKRVAASPETVKKFVGLGFNVAIEKGAGLGAAFVDSAYKNVGAVVAENPESLFKDADVVLKVQRPIIGGTNDELGLYKKDTMLLAHIGALDHKNDVAAYAKAKITVFAMDMVPRISRAQSMDILSSQANLAGYKAVLDGATEFNCAFPMMMTSAGTVAPAKVFVMGVGVAGLQAIATAKRLGAVVTATDVRPDTKEQVESLGGKFLEVDPEMEKDAQTEGGYAKEMPKEYYKKQQAVVAEHIKKQDIVITTALVPGRPAPKLITETMVKSMPMGAVIVDLAVENGGNCILSQAGKVIEKYGVKLVGYLNVPSRIPTSTSILYAKNLYNFLSPYIDKENKTLSIDWKDEIIKGSLITKDGQIVHSALQTKGEGQ